MIAVVAPPGELRDAVLARLPAETRVADPGDDPPTLSRALHGVERVFLACGDDVAGADALAAAEMALVYHCVSLYPLAALAGSAVRSTVLLDDASAAFDADEIAARAARALSEDAPPD